MADPIMYQVEEMFVVLEEQTGETFLSADELLAKLTTVLEQGDVSLPRALDKLESIPEKAEHLRDNYCELDKADGGFLQWYVVRLEK